MPRPRSCFSTGCGAAISVAIGSPPAGRGLGSDVPFFLHGGLALGIGRGDEVFPLPDQEALAVVVAVPEGASSDRGGLRSSRRAVDLDTDRKVPYTPSRLACGDDWIGG